MKKAFVLMIFGMLGAAVFAIPGVSHNVYGTVTINGAAAPDGTIVSARITGTEIISKSTVGGSYGQNDAPRFNMPDSESLPRSGQTVNFFVNGVNSGSTIIFQNGASTG